MISRSRLWERLAMVVAIRSTAPGSITILFAKDTRITESTRLELRFEAYNVFNHAPFFNPVGDINASNFGQVVQAHDPRLIQLGAKFYF